MIISYDISISLIFKIKSYEAQKTFLFDLVAATGMSFCLHNMEVKSSEVWLGATYAASKNGASAEETLLIGAVGLGQTTLWSVGFAMASAGPAGIIVGALIGLQQGKNINIHDDNGSIDIVDRFSQMNQFARFAYIAKNNLTVSIKNLIFGIFSLGFFL